jgi:hypothetical protein
MLVLPRDGLPGCLRRKRVRRNAEWRGRERAERGGSESAEINICFFPRLVQSSIAGAEERGGTEKPFISA